MPKLPERIDIETVRRVFARYDPVALGAAIGLTAALTVFAATAVLLLKGGDVVGPTLSLLGHYLIGFKVSWAGALVGTVEAGLIGFVFGWVLAALINLVIGIHESAFWFAATLE